VSIWTKRSKALKKRGLETPPVLEGTHHVAVWCREVVEVPKTLGKERSAEGSAEVKKRSSGEGKHQHIRTLPNEGQHSGRCYLAIGHPC
jgi:hypothetical protein